MAVKIRLKRLGKIRAPYYRIVVADSRTKRDGRAIEEIGKYHPTEEPSVIEVNRERAQYWLGVGAQPTEQVLALLKITGDWQTFKGLPGAEGTLRFADPKPDRNAIFDAASKQAALAPSEGAGNPRQRPAKKDGEPVTQSPVTERLAPADPVPAPSEPTVPADVPAAVLAEQAGAPDEAAAAAAAEVPPVDATPAPSADPADAPAGDTTDDSTKAEA